ncbi:10241_t:CDS:2 [Ambispora gerdemannii]|uniref:10241_t:CDS:1 n=1 Tax=Ambispora gerdemannii TaxID=144530 RepID=A0A9N8WPD7_9GLOM|nr:10241_t:CDS:2 [Ambispora gerdemannii]
MTTHYFDFYNYEEDLTTLTFAVFCEFQVVNKPKLEIEFASLPLIFQNVVATKPSTTTTPPATNNEASKPEIGLPPISNKNENTIFPVALPAPSMPPISNPPEPNNPNSDLTTITLAKSNPPGSEEIVPNASMTINLPVSNPPDSTAPDPDLTKSPINLVISELPLNPSVPTTKELENPTIVISNPPEITISSGPQKDPISPIGQPTDFFILSLDIFIRDYYDEDGVGVAYSMQMLKTNKGDVWDIIFKDKVQQFQRSNKRTSVPDNILIRNMSRSDAKIGMAINRKPVIIIKRYVTEKGEVKDKFPNGGEIQIKTPPIFKVAVFQDSFDTRKSKEIDKSKILAFKVVEFGINNHVTFGVSGSLKKLVPNIQYSYFKPK